MSQHKQPVYVEYARQMPMLNLQQSNLYPWIGAIIDLLTKRYFKSTELILDSGCGLGANAFYMTKKGYKVVGFDVDLKTIKVANAFRVKTRNDNVLFIAGDMSQIPFGKEKFDGIVCFEMLEHLDNVDLALEQLGYVLKRGGSCAISIPVSTLVPFSIDWLQKALFGKITIDQYAGHLHRFAPSRFLILLKQKGFEIQRELYYAQLLQPLLNFLLAIWRKSSFMRCGTEWKLQTSATPSLGYLLRLICMLITKFELGVFRWAKRGSNLIIVCVKRS